MSPRSRAASLPRRLQRTGEGPRAETGHLGALRAPNREETDPWGAVDGRRAGWTALHHQSARATPSSASWRPAAASTHRPCCCCSCSTSSSSLSTRAGPAPKTSASGSNSAGGRAGGRVGGHTQSGRRPGRHSRPPHSPLLAPTTTLGAAAADAGQERRQGCAGIPGAPSWLWPASQAGRTPLVGAGLKSSASSSANDLFLDMLRRCTALRLWAELELCGC